MSLNPLPAAVNAPPGGHAGRIPTGFGRGPARMTVGWLLLGILLLGALCSAPAQARPAESRGGELPTLVFQGVEIRGNTRVDEPSALRELDLVPGQTITQADLLAAVDRLRGSGLFAQVDYFTRPGASRGHIVLVLEVVEKDAAPAESGFRFGTGNTDQEGWYLIPLEYAAANVLGHGEQMEAQLRIGYRHAGLKLHYRQDITAGGRGFWGSRLTLFNTKRIYYLEDNEVAHRVDRSALDLYAGRRLGRNLAFQLGAKLETVDTADRAEYYVDNPTQDIEAGDPVAPEDLPGEIRAVMGKTRRMILEAGLTLDRRSPQRLAATPAGGLWGRLAAQGILDGKDTFPAASLDIHLFSRLAGGVLSLRTYAAVRGNKAPFFDRMYLGGLYSVRGFPSQSLTRPEGDTWLWQGNLEFRAPLLGDPARPDVAGSLFMDLGQSGAFIIGQHGEVGLGAGWGLRVRVIDAIYIGLDMAVPLSDTPAAEAFHANLSLGWNF